MAQSARTMRYQAPPRTGEGIGARILAWLLSWLVGLALLVGVVGWRYDVAYAGRIFEGVNVNGVWLGGLTPDEAASTLRAQVPQASDERMVLRLGEERWVPTTRDLGIHLDAEGTVQAAYNVGRKGSTVEQWLDRWTLWRGASGNAQTDPLYTRDPVAVDALLTRIANEVARDPRDATVQIQGLSASAIPELPGQQLDIEASRARLLEALANNERSVELVMVERQPNIVGAEAAAEKARALLGSDFVLYFDQPDYRQEGANVVPVAERRQWMIERTRLAELLGIYSTPTENGQHALDVRLRPEALREELQGIAATIAREPRDARFDYDPNTGALTPLIISQDGLRMDVDVSFANLEQAIAEGRNDVQLAVTAIPPEVATSDASKFNITGLAVEGFSDYTGSADEREVNLSVAASQYQGLVIPPGGIFSFNEHLGWVVDATGYEEGYIISGDRTEVDVGGGVCQVSTTFFRAALNAGFDIVERHAHAYRVSYYENGSPLGLDATIFSPIVDLKFRNNTENYYLIEIENNLEANTLAIKLYGPPTGKTVEINSTTLETIPHGPPIYEDDPALPAGVVEQVDWAHDGATIQVERIVRDAATGAEISRDTFMSQYDPWRDRFLRGTGAGE
ncbi:MAG TPA: VanW family protein [Ardenticatenaceae bacterium]